MCNKTKDLRDFDSLYELLDYFTTDEICEEYLAVLRWNGEPTCAYCESNKVKALNGKTRRYKCYGCKKQFSVKVGTIFHDSKISLRKWFVAVYLVTAHKKGISSHQLARDLKITQKTAWFVLQRIREVYKPDNEKFTNEVEIDESWIGGKEKNKHANKKTKASQGRSTKTKTPVLGILERNGKVYAIPVKDTRTPTLVPIMVNKVEEGSKIYTDEYRAYKFLGNFYEHSFVRHSASQYVDGVVHTNSIENFWSHLKRGIDGIYHHVSKKHLDKYINEYTFRFNNRNLSEGSKFDVAIANGVNKRLDYKTLIGEQNKE
ncbi:IS1595 family transposase [Hyunsoonleella sp. SJ7]|uniref:IS1595 family transposase n=1 Tax=Hyunsoonleella aquatilis TaxID=2762758 RepID=A0A923HBP0_9FLAO|nr:IS1595 family transposase [Hyunsoonleella aquatilis]MBC3758126.1 IS1595 family transposase [Hyunsoonleella aquatilis]